MGALADAGAFSLQSSKNLPGGEGGVIAIDAAGAISMQFNSEGMFRASMRADEEPQIAIYG